MSPMPARGSSALRPAERSVLDPQTPAHRARARPAVGHRALRHRHVPAGAALDRRRSRRRHRRRADEPDGLLRRDRRLASSSYGPISDMVGRKAPLYFGLALFALASIGCALATDDPMADRLPLPPGHRRLRRHGHAARHRARPAHRRRGGPADVAADAGVLRVADPGAADRQPASSRLSAGAPCSGRDGSPLLGAILLATSLKETRPVERARGPQPRQRALRLPFPAGRPQFPRPDGDRRLRHRRASSSICRARPSS